MRSPRLRVFAAFWCISGIVRAASFDDRVEALFRPPLAEMIALSPDGQRIAYTTKNGGRLAIVTMSLEPPASKRTVRVEPDREATPPEESASPLRLRFMRWATAHRLVFAPAERVVPLAPVTDASGRVRPNPDGPTIVSPVWAMDADGRQRATLVDARNFQETPADARKTLADLLRTTKELQATRTEAVRWRMPHLDILGFLPNDRDQLIIQTRGAYSVPTQHLVDIRSGTVREFGGEWPASPGEPQVFDAYRLKIVGERRSAARPATAWRDDDLARVQHDLEVKFPRRIVEILDWNETRARVLFQVTGGSDPGRFFVLQRPEDLALEILRRAPWLNASRLHETRFFEFDSTDGARVSGYLTWPRSSRFAPPPLLVVFPSGFPGGAQPAFDPEAQVFADFGFVVARLNHRSVAGIRREDLSALRAAVDHVSVDDGRAAIEWIAAQNPSRPIDRKRVVTLGRGFGGYLAVRALQLQPDVFRCGIALDAPMELRSWLQPPERTAAAVHTLPAALIAHDGTDWSKLSVVEQAETLTNPLLLAVEPARNPAVDASTAALRMRLHALGRAPEIVELGSEFGSARPRARATVYRKIEEFLNSSLQGFAVKVGTAQEVE